MLATLNRNAHLCEEALLAYLGERHVEYLVPGRHLR